MEGIEVDAKQQKDIIDEICTTIRVRARQGIEKQIHMIWYCVAATDWFQNRELILLKQVAQCIKEAETKIPVVFIITKPMLVKEEDFDIIYKSLQQDTGAILPESKDNILEVQAIPAGVGRDLREVTLEAYGLDDLDVCMRKLLPDAIRDTYDVHQRINLQAKIDKANKILLTHYATAGTAIAGGATLTGLDDTWALIGIQLVMFAEIGSVFHFSFNANKVKAALAGSIGVGVAHTVGKTIFHYALAAATGDLSLGAEAVIRVGIADSLTLTVGKAYIELMKKFAKGELSEDQVALEIESLMKSHYNK